MIKAEKATIGSWYEVSYYGPRLCLFVGKNPSGTFKFIYSGTDGHFQSLNTTNDYIRPLLECTGWDWEEIELPKPSDIGKLVAVECSRSSLLKTSSVNRILLGLEERGGLPDYIVTDQTGTVSVRAAFARRLRRQELTDLGLSINYYGLS